MEKAQRMTPIISEGARMRGKNQEKPKSQPGFSGQPAVGDH